MSVAKPSHQEIGGTGPVEVDGASPPAILRLDRRTFLRLIPAGATLAGMGLHGVAAGGARTARQYLPRTTPGGPFRVGVGNSSDPYAATQRALAASSEWPAAMMAGRSVVIKPNLVMAKPASSGATTDPQVVRALVDAALAAGAASVRIVEGGAGGGPPPFATCGYSFFSTYDPRGRVQLVDLGAQPVALAVVPNGLAYRKLYLPALALDPNVVFVSAAKMKCHVDAVATLSMKNLFGLAVPAAYQVPHQLPRMDLHARGVDESIVDLNLARPVDFAVIDGIWGMEGNGPLFGTPVPLNLVLAGRNAVAVDRVGLQAMGIAQTAVPHLAYGAFKNLGPADTSTINVLGDTFTPSSFVPAQTPPTVWYPLASPLVFSPGSGQQTTITYSLPSACSIRTEIIRDSDASPKITLVRTLRDWMSTPPGRQIVTWDGRDDTGVVVRPGLYLVRVQACYGVGMVINCASGWVGVTG